MLKEELMECIQVFFKQAETLLASWHNYSMQHIRLNTANKKKIQDSKFYYIEQVNKKRAQQWGKKNGEAPDTWNNK